jgi:TPR repeat protein
MLNKIVFLFLILISSFYAQENESVVIKKQGFSKHSPLLKPKYPTYSLAATYILKEKAKKGDPFAQHELGIRYILGVGVPIDTLLAADWIGKAASKNLPAANFNYGIMLHGGIGVDWNPFSAYENFKVSAESGMEQAQYIFGLMHTDNLIVNKNLIKAKEWLKKSAEKGFDDAIKVLEEFAKQGIIAQDDTLRNESSVSTPAPKSNYSTLVSNEYELDFYNFVADSLTEGEEKEILNEILASKHNDLKKMLKVSSIQDTSVSKDTTAIGIINYASLAGSPEALLIKARLEENGIGIKQNFISSAANYLKAFRLGSYKAAESLLKISQKNNFYNLLEKEVKKNNPDAMFVWAGLIALGLDYSLTEEQAFELLNKARKQNHKNSIIELGLAYYSGSLVKKDSLKAIDYLTEAVKLGSTEAEIRLAFISIQSAKKSDYKDEISILSKYSQKGSVLAEAALAYCYEHGFAVKQNKGKAASLYRQAAQRGNEAAYNSLRNMYDILRPKEEEFKIYL